MLGRVTVLSNRNTVVRLTNILCLVDYSSSRVMASIAGMLPADVLVTRDDRTFRCVWDRSI
jgi:hypothetical protein